MASGLRVLFGGVWDPATVSAAALAGPGAVLDRGIGAALDDRYARAVEGSWRVEDVILDGGQPVEALLSGRGVHVNVRSTRKAFTRNDDPGYPGTLSGPDRMSIRGYDVVVVKNGYLFPAQTDDSASHFLAVTPGGTDLNADRLRFTALSRPMYPWDTGFEPELSPRVVPPFR